MSRPPPAVGARRDVQPPELVVERLSIPIRIQDFHRGPMPPARIVAHRMQKTQQQITVLVGPHDLRDHKIERGAQALPHGLASSP